MTNISYNDENYIQNTTMLNNVLNMRGDMPVYFMARPVSMIDGETVTALSRKDTTRFPANLSDEVVVLESLHNVFEDVFAANKEPCKLYLMGYRVIAAYDENNVVYKDVVHRYCIVADHEDE